MRPNPPVNNSSASHEAPSRARTQLSSSIFSVNLGISGMRDVTADMTSGGVYAVHVKTSSARFALLASSLKNALAAGLPCTLITGSAPEDLLQRLEQSMELSVSDLLAAGKLFVFSNQDEFAKNMFRYGAKRLLRELEGYAIPPRSFLIFDQADELLSLHDLSLASEQIKTISSWFKEQQVTALLTFCRSNEQRIESLNALLDDLSGLARLGGDKDGIELTFTYWQSSVDVIAARNFRLYIEPLGNYAVSRRELERGIPNNSDLHTQDHVNQATLGLADLSFPDPAPIRQAQAKSPMRSTKQHYVYTDTDLDALGASIDGYLHRVESSVDVLHACLGQPKSVVILSLEPNCDIKEFAKTIHLLRKSLGKTSQIVIREKLYSITASQKQLFMYCGANAVIRKETELSQYAMFLNAIRDQIYSKEIDSSFESIIARMPSSEVMLSTPQIITTNKTEFSPKTQSFVHKSTALAQPLATKVIEKAKRSSILAVG